MIRVVILGSGRGSNAEAILRKQEEGGLGFARVVGIIADKPDAPILKLGPKYDVPALYLKPGKYKTKLTGEAEDHYIQTIRQLAAHLVVLAGFMRVVKPPFIDAFDGRVINLHPSLLPEFPGLNSIRRAYEAKVPETGCTVHWVNQLVDRGQIIEQSKVRIEESDTLHTLEQKVHAAEHALLPKVINDLANKVFLGEI